MTTDPGTQKQLSLTLAFAPIVTLILAFTLGALRSGLTTEDLIVSMLLAATVAGVIAGRRGAGWDAIQVSTAEKFSAVLPVVLILLAIGLLIATWVASGTIPLLVSWGVQLVQPRFFLVTAFLVTAAMSLGTGTSWGSAGSLGVALIGAADALGVPLAPAAGAIVSGAYFGDKMSALSDSTNVCALGAGSELYAHIRHMLYTAGPSFLLCLVIYTVAGGGGAPEVTVDSGRQLLSEIESAFRIDLWALAPLLWVILGVVLRKPPALVLASSSLVAMTLGVWIQGFGVDDIVQAAVSGFRVEMIQGMSPAGASDLFVRLVSRGGLYSMANTLIVIISAFLLAAGMEVSGALDRILNLLLQAARTTFRLIAATMLAGATMISLTSHGGVTALLVGGMFQNAYRDRGLAPENLSRSLEDSVTIVEPLLPWTVSAIFMATTLDVPTVDYLPWAIFCLGGPFFSLLYAAGPGIGIRTRSQRIGQDG